VTEKTIAMGETSVRAMQGKRPLALAFAYRRAVRKNLRRLSSSGAKKAAGESLVGARDVAPSPTKAPVPPAPANGIGRKEEAAHQCGPKSDSEEETTPRMLRRREDDRLLRSWKVDPHQFAAVREEEAAAA